MGTNYYWCAKAPKTCPTCNHIEEVDKLHIGKSSGGWCFSLHVYPEYLAENINTLSDWKQVFEVPGSSIVDEYDEVISPKKMLQIITERNWTRYHAWTEEEYERNYAEPGPNNLVRHQVDSTTCIGHGEGTYDYCVGDFS